MNNVTTISDFAQFRTFIIETDKLTVACFEQCSSTADKQFAAEFEAIANKYCDSARFLKAYLNECENVANDLGIQTTPTAVFFKDGKEVWNVPGVTPELLSQSIDYVLKN
ncbi:thioredoxin family protein [Pandoraea commovens]|uniref:Thioredoxin n=1 Tax=Pandoraea commovens TaxID=2508289 RepID=A0A5E4W452_9BURK|nr:thioredoxin family protein [Pandoraea commovens]VVE17885.1 Thioredoxin [Pandoraea commovens]